jgi:AraC-like DNA-binding protein
MPHQAKTRLPPSAQGGIARLAVERVRSAGLDPTPLLHAAGISAPEIEDDTIRLDVRKQVSLLQLASEALGDEVLGFRLAKEADLRAAGLLYFVIASSATLGDALARAARYSGIANEGIVLRCDCKAELGVRYSYFGVPRYTDRHQLEFWVTAFVRVARQVTGANLRPARVTLAHPRCGASSDLEAYVGCTIDFASTWDEVAYARTAADLPLTNADTFLSDLLVTYCEEALAQRKRPVEALRTRVENVITPILPHGRARVGEVAGALGMSQRTLTRRLATEGLTFAVILEEMRADLGRHYLTDASLSISHIAWLLGFREVSAFTHAFKRWTGQTPSVFRSAMLANRMRARR